jgi:hypothetical protein
MSDFKPQLPDSLKLKPTPSSSTTGSVNAAINQSSKEIEPTKAPVVNQVMIDGETGTFKALTLSGRYQIAKAAIAGEMVPKTYKTPEQVMLGMEYALELGLKPLTALRNIAVINGTPSLWGDLPLSLVMRSGLLEQLEEKILDENLVEISLENKNLGISPYAALCRVKRKGGLSGEKFFTLDDAKRAGLTGKGPWLQYTRRMLQMRARSQALKDLFGDVLSGIAITEYDYNLLPEVNQTASHADRIRPGGGASSLKSALSPSKPITEGKVNGEGETGKETTKEESEGQG